MSFFSRQAIPDSIYDFTVPALRGGVIRFADYRGRKILIVNTASYCGKTPQYSGLQRLWERYGDRMVVVGFPCNNFLFQEPGGSEAIATFCTEHYGITFPLAAKVSVLGWRKAPIYQWLTRKRYNGVADSQVTWNFQKYLLDEHGKLVQVFGPSVEPDAPELLAAIEA